MLPLHCFPSHPHQTEFLRPYSGIWAHAWRSDSKHAVPQQERGTSTSLFTPNPTSIYTRTSRLVIAFAQPSLFAFAPYFSALGIGCGAKSLLHIVIVVEQHQDSLGGVRIHAGAGQLAFRFASISLLELDALCYLRARCVKSCLRNTAIATRSLREQESANFGTITSLYETVVLRLVIRIAVTGSVSIPACVESSGLTHTFYVYSSSSNYFYRRMIRTTIWFVLATCNCNSSRKRLSRAEVRTPVEDRDSWPINAAVLVERLISRHQLPRSPITKLERRLWSRSRSAVSHWARTTCHRQEL